MLQLEKLALNCHVVAKCLLLIAEVEDEVNGCWIKLKLTEINSIPLMTYIIWKVLQKIIVLINGTI